MSKMEIKALKDFDINEEEMDVFGNGCLDDCLYHVPTYKVFIGMKGYGKYCYAPNPFRCTCY